MIFMFLRVGTLTYWFGGLFLLGMGVGVASGGQQFRIPQRVEFSEAVQLPEADHQARSHLDTIDRFLEAQQWDEAIEALGRLMDVAGEQLVPLADPEQPDVGFVRYVPLRVYGQLRLASMHGSADEALAAYRRRVDGPARSALRAALDRDPDRDPVERLRAVVDEYLLSSVGDQALYHLGEFELHRGDFGRARRAWQQISPRWVLESTRSNGYFEGRLVAESATDSWPEGEGTERPASPVYPDTGLDLADVHARLVLVSILEGSADRAAEELERYERLHGERTGTLAGQTGPYRQLLERMLEQSRGWSPPSPPDDWPTFGGSHDRRRVATGEVDTALAPIWTVPLPQREAEYQWLDGVARPGDDASGLLSYHPIVVGEKVILATGERIEDIRAFDLGTGRSLWPAPGAPQAPEPEEEEPSPLALPLVWGPPGIAEHWGVPRFTLTAAAGRLYAKLGHQATSVVSSDRYDPPAPGSLVALDLEAERRRLFEIVLESEQAAAGWAFEGAPLVDGENLYVAMRRRENLRTQFHVACYTMRRNRATLLWRRQLISAESPGQGELEEYTHNLLTLDEGVLYANTNLGAVAALEAHDGRIRWLTRYRRVPLTNDEPRSDGRYLFRDLNPCLIHREKVLVAPSDTDRIFALDRYTGRPVWDTGSGRADDAVHLLGVGGGHLLASGDRLYWIDVETGRLRARFPERIEESSRGYGRGLLVDNLVLWPTRERIHVLAQDAPRLVRQPIELSPLGMTGGNLLLAGDTLLVAGANQLAAYNPWGRQATKTE